MTTMLAYINGTIMALLGFLHLYWASGGKWGLDQAIPTDKAGNKTLRPGTVACLVVGVGLLGFAAYYVSIAMAYKWILPLGFGIWGLGVIFSVRAIGDFKQVGFFKTIKDTEFGRMDSRWYSPLCLYLGLSSFWIGSNM